ncbi:MAG: RcnB family protein, partial [Candidatus Binataceae bacterium]
MKKMLLCTVLATVSLSVALPALADPPRRDRDDHHDRDRDDRYDRDRDRDHDRGEHRGERRHWVRGDRLTPEYFDRRYEFTRWRDAHLYAPPPGARWLLIDGQFVLASRGEILRVVVAPPAWIDDPRPEWRDDWRDRWQARYHHVYTMEEDPYYSRCRSQPDPAGALVGAVIGGLLGNAAGGRHDQGAATFAGVIAGGAIGASLTSHLSCDDQSYAYKTYAQGFGAGRPNATYTWQNPRTGVRGQLHVLDYYEDEDNFRCAAYSQTVYVD